MTKEQRKLIERYLQNDLTGSELKHFIDRLESDNELKKQVTFLNLLHESIRAAEDKRILNAIEKHINYKKPLVPFPLKLIILFVVISVAGIALWNFNDQNNSKLRSKYLSFDFYRGNYSKEKDIQKPDSLVPDKTGSPKNRVNKIEGKKINDSKPLGQDTLSTANDNGNEIVVKQDQLLIGFSIKPIIVDGEPRFENADSNTFSIKTAQSLNPGADLPIPSEEPTSYFVEFWVSPVNYKGYKLSRNKLILFGIDEPDAVQLYLKNNKLLMKYGAEHFLLEPSDTFEPFITDEAKSTISR